MMMKEFYFFGVGQLSAFWEGGGREVPQSDGVLHPRSTPQQSQPACLSLLWGKKTAELRAADDFNSNFYIKLEKSNETT